MGHDENLNIDKVVCLSHTFHLFLGAARAALFPFLTIYFRLLGLTATQTGLLLGAKAFMTFVCAPVWTACAKRFNKKKMVLMFSLFMLMASNLLLCLVPPVSEHAPVRVCDSNPAVYRPGTNGTDIEQVISINGSMLAVSTSTLPPLSSNISQPLATPAPAKTPEEPSPSTPSSVNKITAKKVTEKSTTTTLATKAATTSAATTTTSSTTVQPSTKASTASTTTTETPSTKRSTLSDFDKYYDNNFPKEDEGKGEERGSGKYRQQPASKDASEAAIEAEEKELLKELGLSMDDFSKLSSSDLDDLLQQVSQEGKSRQKRNILQDVKNKWDQLSDRFEIAEYQTFVIILMLIILGELFSAPYEKLADECWFEYLDLLDSLERFGGQNVWRTIGYILIPTIITAIIDHTTCILPFGIHHFYIHFFTFAIIMMAVFLTGFCYPVSQNKQTPKRSRMSKGIKVLCSDLHAFSMTFTMIILGVAAAVMSNFLMWKLQDLSHSGEMVMGVAIAVASGSEFVLQLVGRSLVKKLTPVGAVCLGLLLLVGRLIFYSFLWNPWLVLAGEVLHGMSGTLIWIAIRTYPDFRINPFVMDRSASSVINALYLGVGFASGSMVSGLLYDKLGFAILFQGTAGLVFLWGVVFLILQKAVKKKEKVRYAKLLQEENADDSDESVIYDEDWLEVAMKRDRK